MSTNAERLLPAAGSSDLAPLPPPQKGIPAVLVEGRLLGYAGDLRKAFGIPVANSVWIEQFKRVEYLKVPDDVVLLDEEHTTELLSARRAQRDRSAVSWCEQAAG